MDPFKKAKKLSHKQSKEIAAFCGGVALLLLVAGFIAGGGMARIEHSIALNGISPSSLTASILPCSWFYSCGTANDPHFSLTANTYSISSPGQPVTLTWTAYNNFIGTGLTAAACDSDPSSVEYCYISGYGAVGDYGAVDNGYLTASRFGSVTVYPTQTTTYTLVGTKYRSYDGAGGYTWTAWPGYPSVTITGLPQPSITFFASEVGASGNSIELTSPSADGTLPNRTIPGDQINVWWYGNAVSGCSIYKNNVSQGAIGMPASYNAAFQWTDVAPTGNDYYRIQCTSGLNSPGIYAYSGSLVTNKTSYLKGTDTTITGTWRYNPHNNSLDQVWGWSSATSNYLTTPYWKYAGNDTENAAPAPPATQNTGTVTIPATMPAGVYFLNYWNGASAFWSNVFSVKSAITWNPQPAASYVQNGAPQITATWNDPDGANAQDWIALVANGTNYVSGSTLWVWATTNTQTQGAAGATSHVITFAPSMAQGTYQLVYYLNQQINGQWVEEARSTAFTITAPAYSVTPTSGPPFIASTPLAIQWSNSGSVTNTDWVALLPHGGTWPTGNLGWFYTGNCTETVPGAGRASGSCSYFSVPNSPGTTYDVVYYYNGVATELARGSFTVAVACSGAHVSGGFVPNCTCTSPWVWSPGASACIIIPGNLGTGSNAFLANPSRVRKGSTTTLKWTPSNMVSCGITSSDASTALPAGSGQSAANATNGTHTLAGVTVNKDTKYTLTCTDGNGTVLSQSVNVSLVPTYNEL